MIATIFDLIVIILLKKKKRKKYNNSAWNFYAPFMGIMFSGLCVRLFVRLFVCSSACPSVLLQVTVFGRGQVKLFGQGSF